MAYIHIATSRGLTEDTRRVEDKVGPGRPSTAFWSKLSAATATDCTT
ncbi:MAG: hypothetical protein ACLQI7_23120 [Streptosporangiaceae bacterium]